MFLCASRLPSCAPGCVPSHGSGNQITAGQPDSVGVVVVLARPLRTCGMEVAEPQGAARRRMRPCRGVRTIDA